MKNSRLIEVFLALDKKEVKELGKFVRSPFFNQRQDVIDLYDYLKKRAPFTNQKYLDRKLVFKEIYPKTPFNDKQFGYVMSFLFQNIKTYLSYCEFQTTPLKEEVYLSRTLRKRGLSRIFEKELNLAQKALKEQSERNVDYHLNQYLFQYEKCQLISAQKRKVTKDYEVLSEELTTYFVANILKLSCMLINMGLMSTKEYSMILLEEALKMIEKENYSTVPSISVYYNIYKSMTAENHKPYFYELRRLATAHGTCFPTSELTDIYLCMVNYCIKVINKGNMDFVREGFEVYKEGLSQSAFLENDTISKFTYKNIVSMGCSIKEFEYVETFMHDYKEKISIVDREAVFNYNLAFFYFKKPDYNKAMELLLTATFDDLYYDLDARRMLMIMYYELDEFDALSSLLDSFKNFIYRHKELGYRSEIYLNLIRLTKRLVQLNKFDKTAVAALKKDVEEAENLPDRKWLLEQLDKLL